jgi:hypothetical protein
MDNARIADSKPAGGVNIVGAGRDIATGREFEMQAVLVLGFDELGP